MESNNKQTQDNQVRAQYTEPKVFLTKDSEYLIHLLPGNVLIRKHRNFYLKVLGLKFQPKVKQKTD